MKKRTVYIITGTALALGAVFCIVKLAIMLYQPKASLTATMATSVDSASTEESSDAEPADPSDATADVYGLTTVTASILPQDRSSVNTNIIPRTLMTL